MAAPLLGLPQPAASLEETDAAVAGPCTWMRAGRLDLVLVTRRPRSWVLESVPLADEEYLLVARPAWARRVAEHPDAGDLCAALR